jgi:hypothetical protein
LPFSSISKETPADFAASDRACRSSNKLACASTFFYFNNLTSSSINFFCFSNYFNRAAPYKRSAALEASFNAFSTSSIASVTSLYRSTISVFLVYLIGFAFLVPEPPALTLEELFKAPLLVLVNLNVGSDPSNVIAGTSVFVIFLV